MFFVSFAAETPANETHPILRMATSYQNTLARPTKNKAAFIERPFPFAASHGKGEYNPSLRSPRLERLVGS